MRLGMIGSFGMEFNRFGTCQTGGTPVFE